MRADHTVLKGRRRRPGTGCPADRKAVQRDVISPGFRGEEAVSADIDLYVMLSGISPAKICIDDRLGIVHFREPAAGGQVLPPSQRPRPFPPVSPKHLIQRFRLIQRIPVQVHFAGVHHPAAVVPVPRHLLPVGVERSEHGVGENRFPGISFKMLPAVHHLRAGNHGLPRHLCPVHNGAVRRPPESRVHIFPIGTRSHQNLIAGPGKLRRPLNAAEGGLPGAVPRLPRVYIHIIPHCCYLHAFSQCEKALFSFVFFPVSGRQTRYSGEISPLSMNACRFFGSGIKWSASLASGVGKRRD